jgi:carboxyl-terminal processing protease
LRHAQFVRRHRDLSFRAQIARQDVGFSLKVYAEVLAALQANYVDAARTNFTLLFRSGLSELDLALSDDGFRQAYLPSASADAIQRFRHELTATWANAELPNHRETVSLVVEVAVAAQKRLGLRPVITVLEFACGACNGLDEYTLYLTPAQLSEELAALDGESISVGVDVGIENSRMVITQVLLGSPAAAAGLKTGDLVFRVNQMKTAAMSARAVAKRLKGKPGSSVELEVLSCSESKPRTIRLTRQPVRNPTVLQPQMVEGMAGIAYCHLAAFQKSTPEELDEALGQLQMQGMKALILDLRGNGGGLFEPAVQVVERFLAEGVIVATQAQSADQSRTYRASNSDPLGLPLVVLIDSGTASAAEIVAGALKDNNRATLVGQPSYGKGSIQRVLKLESAGAGIRVTLARYFSPRGQAYSGVGVIPHVLIDRTPLSLHDSQLEEAIREAERLITMH